MMEPPPILPEEDELSFQRFNNMLKAESRKKKANNVVVSTLMDTTFAQRRAEMLKSTASVETLLQEYPFLGTQKERAGALLPSRFFAASDATEGQGRSNQCCLHCTGGLQS